MISTRVSLPSPSSTTTQTESGRSSVMLGKTVTVERNADQQTRHLIVVLDTASDMVALEIGVVRVPRHLRQSRVDALRVAFAKRIKILPYERYEHLLLVLGQRRQIHEEFEPPRIS